jgi:anti-sigma B factor antagonist
MVIQSNGKTLRVGGIQNLGAHSAGDFRDQVRAALGPGQKDIEVDLSQTSYLDSCGLGALIGLYKIASSREGKLRLLDPQPAVEQLLQLTRMHRVFEIVKN